MKRPATGVVFSLLADLLVLLVCILHYPALRDRSAAPFLASRDGGIVYVSEILSLSEAGGLLPGDMLLAWNGMPIPIPSVVEFLGDRGRIGDSVTLEVRREGADLAIPVTLVPAHTGGYIAAMYATGAVTLLIGIFVLLARPGNRVALLMHWGLTAIAALVVLGFENVTPSHTAGYLPSALFFAAYASVATAFLLFATEFPRSVGGPFPLRAALAGVPPFLLGVTAVLLHRRATAAGSVDLYIPYRFWFDVLRIAVIAATVGSTLRLVRSFRTTPSASERKRLLWILWGLTIGPLPFLLFTALPQAVTGAPLLPEHVTLLFFLNIPITFAVAFIRYHLLDIDVVISRSATYFVVLVLLGGLYAAIVARVATAVSHTWASAAGAVAVALLFEPVRVMVQRFVDRRFFRSRYDERAARSALSDDIRNAVDMEGLAESFVRRVQELIPVERIGFFVVDTPHDRLRMLAHRNYDILQGRTLRFERSKLRTRLELPEALPEQVEPGVPHSEGDRAMFGRWKVALVLPIASEGSHSEGFLVLGPRKSGGRFSVEDVDLLRTAAVEAGLAVGRNRLQQEVIHEKLEAERLRELNRIKSDFVSYVSHDLKTPLTNIKMYAGFLRETSGTARKQRAYVETIEGESDRLTRMVDTILDSAAVEAGVLTLDPRPVDLREVIGRTLATMHYQLENHGFTAHWKKPARAVTVVADAERVCQALANLIGNALKYAGDGKEITIALKRSGGRVWCSVADRGPGIPPGVLPHLFERFYRDPARSRKVRGVGLGLPFVRDIMLAHGGTVEVQTSPEKGSTFTLVFPDGSDHGKAYTDPGR